MGWSRTENDASRRIEITHGRCHGKRGPSSGDVVGLARLRAAENVVGPVPHRRYGRADRLTEADR